MMLAIVIGIFGVVGTFCMGIKDELSNPWVTYIAYGHYIFFTTIMLSALIADGLMTKRFKRGWVIIASFVPYLNTILCMSNFDTVVCVYSYLLCRKSRIKFEEHKEKNLPTIMVEKLRTGESKFNITLTTSRLPHKANWHEVCAEYLKNKYNYDVKVYEPEICRSGWKMKWVFEFSI